MLINLDKKNYKYLDNYGLGGTNTRQFYDYIKDKFYPVECHVRNNDLEIRHGNTIGINPDLIGDPRIKDILITNRWFLGATESTQELNVLAFTTLLASALKEATNKIDQLEQNVLRLDQELNQIKERIDK